SLAIFFPAQPASMRLVETSARSLSALIGVIAHAQLQIPVASSMQRARMRMAYENNGFHKYVLCG
ncbi:hypothetical protein, partial [Paraburkholderia tropica]|uniref:hypothetical protein n=1 Tax=Paraburkholderia tropica TaxID=92647 RepID=UPI002ABE7271